MTDFDGTFDEAYRFGIGSRVKPYGLVSATVISKVSRTQLPHRDLYFTESDPLHNANQ
jgi:hypothetical protein